MADLEKEPPKKIEAEDEEPIIELEDEIDAEPGDLLDLEQNLLDLEKEIGRRLGEEPEPDAERRAEPPELSTVGWDDAGGADRASGAAEKPLDDLDWLLSGLNQAVSPGTEKVEDVLENELLQGPFDEEEQFLEAEEIEDDEAPPPEVEKPALALDLPDAGRIDDELAWLDEPAGREAAEGDAFSSETPLPPSDVDLILGAPAFPTAEALFPPEPPGVETQPAAAPETALPAALAAAPLTGVPGTAAPAPESAPLSERIALSREEIESAVARLIAEKYGARIEAIIFEAIEKAVSKEIERLKGLLRDADL